MKNFVTKVLLVDDDEAIVDVTTMMLEYMGYKVEAALNGENVHQIIQNQPDIVILDVWLAGMDGRDICRTLKTDANTAHIPVLMISASKNIKDSVLASGANDFLEKPFEIESLVEKIERLTS